MVISLRWSLKYGLQSLALTNLVSNSFINTMYRKNFFLYKANSGIALFSSIILTCVFPTAASATILHEFYLNNMLRASSDSECWLCRELKSIGMHLMVGSLVPTTIAWYANFYHASLFKTYPVPQGDMLVDAKKRKVFFNETKKIFFKTNKNAFPVLMASYSFQIIFSSFIFYTQRKQFEENIKPLKFSLLEIKKLEN